MYNYEHMAIIIKDYLKQFEGQTEKVHLTALEARKLHHMKMYQEQWIELEKFTIAELNVAKENEQAVPLHMIMM